MNWLAHNVCWLFFWVVIYDIRCEAATELTLSLKGGGLSVLPL